MVWIAALYDHGSDAVFEEWMVQVEHRPDRPIRALQPQEDGPVRCQPAALRCRDADERFSDTNGKCSGTYR